MKAGPCVPKRSFSAPMRVGPRKAPILAIVTTNAIPAAAAGPVRNRVGIEQNGPYAAQCPTGNERQGQDGQSGPGKENTTENPATVTNNGKPARDRTAHGDHDHEPYAQTRK